MLQDVWKGMGRGARAGLLVGVAAIVAGTVGAGALLLRTDYQMLFNHLAPGDAAAMIAELDRMKVPYRLEEGGTAILVEGDAVHRTRIKLMGKELPLNGAVGFELFNNADFGMTEFAQKVNYQRALQGELARTIMSLSEVASVRVHLAMPEDGLFKRGGSRPKASITVALKAGQALRAEQIVGIQRLVSSSVPGIANQDVTIVDQRGVALSRSPGESEGAEPSTARLDLKRETESYLVRKVEAILERALGPGQASAMVDVTLDMDQVRVSTEDVLPASGRGTHGATGVVVRERESVRDAGGMVETRQGQAMPTGSATREIDYQVGRRVEHVVSQPGSIRRLQVVAVTRLPLDPQRLEAVRETVSAAVGAVRARGDTVVVQTVDAFADPFVATEPEAEAEDAEAGPDTAVVAAPGAAAEAIADRLSVSRLAGLLGLQGTAGSVTALLIASGVGVLAVALFVWTLRAGLRRGATPTRDPHVRGESVLTEAQRAVALARVKDWLAEGAGVSGDAGQGLKR